MTQKKGKGWTRAGQYQHKEYAQKRATWLRGWWSHVIVEKGTFGQAWHKPRTVYRI